MREYVFFPCMKSKLMQSMSSHLKRIFGKKYGKMIATSLSLFVSWFFTGFWHGGSMNYIAVTLWMWMVIVMSELLSEACAKVSNLLSINTDCDSWKVFRCIRTYVLFSFGVGFFPVSQFKEGIRFYKLGFSIFNPWVLFDGTLYDLGLSEKNFRLMILLMILLLVVDIIHERNISIRNFLITHDVFVRWTFYFLALFGIIILGMYGPAFDAGKFIYQGF